MLVVLTSLMVAFVCSLAKPRLALGLLVFFTPWLGMGHDVGVYITAQRVFALALFIPSIARLVSHPDRLSSLKPQISTLVAYLAFVLASTTIQIAWLPEMDVSGGELRNAGFRSLAQSAIFLLQIVPAFAVLANVEGENDLEWIAKVYIGSTTILAALGVLQLAVWMGTGTDIFPISLIDARLGGPNIERSGIFSGILRICAFGGEPKGLAQSLAISLLIIQATWISKQSRSDVKSYVIWGANAVAMVFTWSTSGFYVWALGSAILLVKAIAGRQRFQFQLLTFGLAFIVLAVVQGVSGGEIGGSIQGVLEQRTVERGLLEGVDLAIVKMLADNPSKLIVGTGLGSVHLFSMDYLQGAATVYAYGTSFSAKSGYLRILSESGLIGALLFALATISIIRVKDTALADRIRKTASLIGWLLLFAFLARVYIVDQFWLAVGAALTSKWLSVRTQSRAAADDAAPR